MASDVYERIYIRGMSARKMRELILTVWKNLDAACSMDTRALSLWVRLNEATHTAEKQHRATALQTGASPRASVETAAKYHAALAVLREVPPAPVSWLAAGDIRPEWLLGHALAEHLREPVEHLARRMHREDVRDFMLLDYVEDLA
jgi:hypothetical protein